MEELKFQVRLQAPMKEIWHAWTDSDTTTRWFSPHANIEPKLGGAYELFFDPENHEQQCTKGCKITKFEPYTHLSFSWRGPEELHHVMDPDTPQTHVHVSLKEKGAETEVTIIHDGWGTGKDWKEAKDWHQRAWTQVVSSLVVTMSGKKYPIAYRTVYFQLKVEGLERAKRFYEEVFGLEVSWYMSPEVGWCELNLPGEGSRLGLNAGGSGGVLTFDVEDLEAAKAYLEGKGLETSEITDNPDMVSYFNTKDSEGNAIQIVSDPRVSSK